MANSKNTKKGYFFTILILITLSFLLAVITARMLTTEAREEKLPIILKGESMHEFVKSISGESMNSVGSAIAQKALYKLNNKLVMQGYWGAGTYPTESEIKAELESVIWRGKLKDGTDIFDSGDLTLSKWNESMATLAAARGLNFSASMVPNEFYVYQTDSWTVSITFNMTADIKDNAETMLIHGKKIQVNATVSIEGFEDPLIAEKGYSLTNPQTRVIKQIIREPALTDYTNKNDYQRPNVRGKSWVYGNVTDDWTKRGKSYILRIPATELTSSSYGYLCLADGTCQNASLYGGIILENFNLIGALEEVSGTVESREIIVTDASGTPTTYTCSYTRYIETKDCFDCLEYYDDITQTPAAAGSDPDADCKLAIPTYTPTPKNSINVPFVAIKDTNAALMQNKNVLLDCPLNDNAIWSGTVKCEFWNIENLRAMAIKGYYCEDTKAPSFLERMQGKTAPASTPNENGISSLLVSRWTTIDYSKLDYEYFALNPGADYKIKGMPGCKSVEMCSSPGSPLGIFELGSSSLSSFGAESLTCSERAP
ncbi:MAG: hypothetical protein ABIH99_06080, partial [Candidatus Micrarchaeota archaeon]